MKSEILQSGMGCVPSKSDLAKNGKDSIPPSTHPPSTTALTPEPPDPRIGLNTRQVFLLSKSWKAIHRDVQAAGVEVIMK